MTEKNIYFNDRKLKTFHKTQQVFPGNVVAFSVLVLCFDLLGHHT